MLRRLTFLIFLLVAKALAAEDFRTFSEFLARLHSAKGEEKSNLVASFIDAQKSRGGFPIIEPDGVVYFFYYGTGTEKEVRLVGDFFPRTFYNVYWEDKGQQMIRPEKDLPMYYLRMQFEKDARLDYKFLIDEKYILDPLNSNQLESGTAPANPDETVAKSSVLTMPEYRWGTYATKRSESPEGKLISVAEAWVDPKITIYLPAGYDPAKSYPVLYTADGSAWIHFIRLPVILDNLITERKIEPPIAVMIDSIQDRRTWYYFNPDYLSYLEKVVRYVDSHYSTHARPESRVHVGSSAGGSITLYTGLERPDLFRNLAMLSPSLSGPPHYYEPYFTGSKKPPALLKIYMSAGTYEPFIHQDTITMERYFKSAGLSPKVSYFHEGHSFGAWRRAAEEMLLHFFAR